MKHILGLDLGTTSIGWALIKADNNGTPIEINDMGVRLVPLVEKEDDTFTRGQSNTINADRTKARGIRRNYDRYQLRRQALTDRLRSLDMLPTEELIKLPVLELWQLRAKAVTNRINLKELGRVLYHLNQKRGYRHSKSDDNNPKQREYVKNINNRYAELKESKLTIGQFFAKKLEETAVKQGDKVFFVFRIKDLVYPRKAYEEEYDAIMKCQQAFYPEILTDEIINNIRNNIIYYQRELRSCKHLVSVCEFEKRCFYDKDGEIKRNHKNEIIYDGPKVAPRTSPLFQLFKNWQAINNIRFHNKNKEYRYITKDEKQLIAQLMNEREILKLREVQNILSITSKSGWYCDKALKNGIKGNTTRMAIVNALSTLPNYKIEELTRFNIEMESTNLVDTETGDILLKVKDTYQNEPLYTLWHIIYSIKNDSERFNVVSNFLKKYDVNDEIISRKLTDIDFTTPGYANLSSKAICKILPYLMEGIDYSDACEYVGYNHSNSLTKQENEEREILDKIPALKKNDLRQPTVEKILNQTINVFNKINERLLCEGSRIDEIRVELARDLKRSKEEREEASEGIRKQQRKNDEFANILKSEGLTPTRNRILKYRLYIESHECCFYCNQPLKFKEFINFAEAEREHIIPKSLLFDDSFANQVCSCRKCNKEKGGRTALDYMRTTDRLDSYVQKVDEMFKKHEINGKKHSHLLSSYEDYLERKKLGKETKEDINLWEKPIDRQLRLSQYISKKALELLQQGCREVVATSGEITHLLRNTWGYDTILHELNLPRYQGIEGLTEIKINETNGQQREVITGWTKRLDHRHHAIDALAVACTSRSIIQKINTLSASRDEMRNEISASRKDWKDNNLLQQWIKEKKPFARSYVMKHVDSILISMKAGKKATVPGKRKIYKNGKPITVQIGLRIPRGQLHEQTIYGAITQYDKNSKPHREIVTRYKLGIGQGYIFSGKETCDVVFDKKKNCFVINDDIEKTLNYIVDKHIREVVRERLNQAFPENETYRSEAEKAFSEGKIYNGKERCKKALEQLRNIDVNPIFTDKDKNITIKSARCFTGLSAVQPLRFNANNEAISFVLTKNNHHVAIYKDENGDYKECIYTFWQIVERSKYGLPLIIDNTKELWGDIDKRTMDGQELPNSLLESLPQPNWTFIDSLQRNDMFIMDLSDEEINDYIATNNYSKISKHLYRVQTISKGDYFFRLHIDTTTDHSPKDSMCKKFIRAKGLKSYISHNPHKVTISLLGKIIDK